jgi:peroxiredoxin
MSGKVAAAALGVVVIAGAVLFFGVNPSATKSSAPHESAAPSEPKVDRFVKVWVGDTFPDFEVPRLDGGTYKLSRDRDPKKYTVINMHSPDCPCAANCASLIGDMEASGVDDVEVLGILAGVRVDEDFIQRSQDQVDEGLVTFRLYTDPENKVRTMLDAKRTPTVWVLDKDGTVAFVGAPENTLFPGSPGHRYLLRDALDALRAGKKPDPQFFEPLGCPIDPNA